MFLFLLSLMFTSPSHATSMYFVSNLQQAQQSDAVVIATIGDASSAPHPTYNTVMTETSIVVDEVLVGDAPKELTIRQIGGTLNGKTLHVPGDARLQKGSKVVLFLNAQDEIWYLTAMEQSKYDLSFHPKLGWIMKRNLPEGLWTRNAEGVLTPYKPKKQKPYLSLHDFRQSIVKGDAR